MMYYKEKIKIVAALSLSKGCPICRVIAIITMLTVLFSCEKTIKMDIKNERRRIVVNGFLNAQQPVRVNISKSQHILDNDSIHYISDAKVYLLKNETVLDTLIFSQDGDYLSHNFLPEVGVNYKIKISAEGLQDVEASDYIPDLVPIISIDTSTVMYSGGGDGIMGSTGESREMLRCKIKFHDPAGQQNYYQLWLHNPSYSGGYEGNNTMYFETDDTSVENFIMNYGAFFNDVLFDGKNYELNIYIDKIYQGPVYFMLFSVSKSYSLYFRTLANSQQNSGPFTEPIFVYNNITNGLGIFAGYSLYVDSLIFGQK